MLLWYIVQLVFYIEEYDLCHVQLCKFCVVCFFSGFCIVCLVDVACNWQFRVYLVIVFNLVILLRHFLGSVSQMIFHLKAECYLTDWVTGPSHQAVMHNSVSQSTASSASSLCPK